MTAKASAHTPTEVKLHRKSRVLSIGFADGRRFELPCEYLRVFSPAKEVRMTEAPVTGREGVNIERIEPQGQYAVRLIFDDGHDTGIYSWDTLYELGKKQKQNWALYLSRLDAVGYRRRAPGAGRKRLRLMYFAHLVKKLRKETEEVEVPESVTDVSSLLAWLRRRQPEAAPLFADDRLRITVNRQFAEPFTRLETGDEIGLVPNSPMAPPTPDLV